MELLNGFFLALQFLLNTAALLVSSAFKFFFDLIF